MKLQIPLELLLRVSVESEESESNIWNISFAVLFQSSYYEK